MKIFPLLSLALVTITNHQAQGQDSNQVTNNQDVNKIITSAFQELESRLPDLSAAMESAIEKMKNSNPTYAANLEKLQKGNCIPSMDMIKSIDQTFQEEEEKETAMTRCRRIIMGQLNETKLNSTEIGNLLSTLPKTEGKPEEMKEKMMAKSAAIDEWMAIAIKASKEELWTRKQFEDEAGNFFILQRIQKALPNQVLAKLSELRNAAAVKLGDKVPAVLENCEVSLTTMPKEEFKVYKDLNTDVVKIEIFKDGQMLKVKGLADQERLKVICGDLMKDVCKRTTCVTFDGNGMMEDDEECETEWSETDETCYFLTSHLSSIAGSFASINIASSLVVVLGVLAVFLKK